MVKKIMALKPTIGLEIHAELKTRSKMFCSCLNDPGERRPNLNICPVCMGHPGTLPVINKEAVRKVVKTGLALKCRIPEKSKFDRKNYFYPDLPKGYQISQYDLPLCQNGFLDIEGKKIRVRRVHLEEDTGRLLHSEKDKSSLVDFNRAGVPLMELVTEPDIKSAKEAKSFSQELQLILRYLGVSEADMEKGQLRVEANVSLSDDSEKLGTKVEVKNLNSFRSVERAIDFEIARQKEILEKKGKVLQETRGWNEPKQETISQRLKEEANDYRYFPEPDLPSLNTPSKYVQELCEEIGELPQQRRKRFLEEYGLTENEVESFVVNKDLGEYYEKSVSELRNWVKEADERKEVNKEEFLKLAKIASNYILSDLLGLIKAASVVGEDFLITPENFGEFITLVYKEIISSKTAKEILKEMFATGKDPSHILKKRELSQITDKGEIDKAAKEVLASNAKVVEDFKKGKRNALQFLVGQVMAKTKGRANPSLAREALEKNIF